MGRIVSTLSLTRLQKYSLFQKYNARSATCMSNIELERCLKGGNARSTHLEMGAGNRLGQLVEQGLLHLSELARVHDLKDVFDLIKIHDFFGAVGFGPEAQQTKDDLGDG